LTIDIFDQIIPIAIQEPGILGMRFERIFGLKISADSLALPKEILSQKGAKGHRLKSRFLDGGGYNPEK
jgi:hypothetical protein